MTRIKGTLDVLVNTCTERKGPIRCQGMTKKDENSYRLKTSKPKMYLRTIITKVITRNSEENLRFKMASLRKRKKEHSKKIKIKKNKIKKKVITHYVQLYV